MQTRTAFLLLTMTGLVACGSNAPQDQGASAQGVVNVPAKGVAESCRTCASDLECQGSEVCAQFSGDGFCADPCADSATCATSESCQTVTTQSGQTISACLPTTDVCGAQVGTTDQTGEEGDARKKKDAGPAPKDAGSGFDGGAPVHGTIGVNGGTVSRLHFAVVGDSRPPTIDDTKGYPSAIVNKIFQDVQDASPAIPFVVSTGDYQFSRASGTQAATQLDLYIAARAPYSGIVFPAMGNHECTGATTSNCGTGTANGITNNYSAFMSKIMTPLGKTSPNYTIAVNAADSSWTAKFVFVAGNAWTASDVTWLDGVLSKPTTYTFIVRHEPSAASTAPGVTPSEAVMKKHPYTLAIVGHTHTYGKTGAKQVTIGNGGAPLTTKGNFGYGLIDQRANGSIEVDMIDYQTGAADTAFRFALNADGTPAAL